MRFQSFFMESWVGIMNAPTLSEIEANLKPIVSERFIELWWDLRIPGLGGLTPKQMFESDPARLLEYTKSYSDPSFS